MTAKIPESKKKAVKELSELIKNSKTVLVASIKNLPSSEFQEIGKNLRGKATVKVPKKTLMKRAIDESKNEKLAGMKEELKDSFAILFSSMDSYELAGELLRNKTPAKAKPGQIAPTDLVIPAGPTELTPGPAISELGALGIQIQIKAGKIEIVADKVVAKEGEAISQGASDMLGKLDVRPFSVGYIPLLAFDTTENVLYKNIEIDSEKALSELLEANSRALPFAVNIGYATQETIKYILTKANMYGRALSQKIENSIEKTEESLPEKKDEGGPSEEKEETNSPEKKDEENSSENTDETK